MKILMVHNHYQQPGGEDEVFADECRLLTAHGHSVVSFTRHNDAIDGMSRLRVARDTIWNRSIEAELVATIQRERPDVMHCHNTFPMISPSAYYAARSESVAVVQTLHNYRLLCPGATLLRDGKVCEECIGRVAALPAVRHACYRGNRSATATTAAMLAVHHQKKTWQEAVDRYIALTEFARQKFIDGGFPADRICVKPNLVAPDPGPGLHDGRFAVFVGRLSEEKGIRTLLDAWKRTDAIIPLKILGDGPLAEDVRVAAADDPRIEWLGRVDRPTVDHVIGRATMLVMPSVCYETFGRTIVEAFAAGTPVVASRMGAMQELVHDGRTGLLFNPGDERDLIQKVCVLWDSAGHQRQMQAAARSAYEENYTAEPNYRRLLEIYEAALGNTGSQQKQHEPPRALMPS